MHICQQGGFMCRIWDWQATIVRDLNDSQDPKHMLYCRESAFVAILRVFFSPSENHCALFACLGGGGSPKGNNVTFFYRFFLYQGFPKLGSLIFELPVRMHIWHCHTILHICRGRRGQCPWRIFCHVEKFQI